MKKNYLIFLISLLLIINLAGCSPRCEEFNNDIVNWMPYEVNDKIAISRDGSSDTLTVNSSEIYHTDKIGYGSKCICTDSFILGLSSASMNIDIRFNDSSSLEQSEIVINDEWFGYSEQLDRLYLNGQTYTNLIIYQNTNQLASNKFWTVIVSKSVGIIAIIGETEEWLINDGSEKDIEISDIAFKSSDC